MTDEHIVNNWIPVIRAEITDYMNARDCDKDCKVVAVLQQEVKDNKDILIDVRDTMKSFSNMMASQLYVAVFTLIGLVFAMLFELIKK